MFELISKYFPFSVLHFSTEKPKELRNIKSQESTKDVFCSKQKTQMENDNRVAVYQVHIGKQDDLEGSKCC